MKRVSILILMLAFLAACGSDEKTNMCEDASSHVQACLGGQTDGTALPRDCDENVAEDLLAQDCSAIEETFLAAGDDKADLIGWTRSVGCFLEMVPLTDCFPEDYRGVTTDFAVVEIVDGMPQPRSGVVVRWSNEKIPEVVVEGTSDGFGALTLKIPTTAFTKEVYTVEVIEDGEVLFTSTYDFTIAFFMNVTFEEDGTVTMCRWRDDDLCDELEPAR